MKKRDIALIVIVLTIIIDQALKIYIKTNFPIGGGFDILGASWAKIYFVENIGMAFGLSWGGTWGKLVLSLFRIIAIFGIFLLLLKWIRDNYPTSAIIGLSLVFAGAFGNVIDGVFYGVMFSESTSMKIAEIFPADGGYAPMFWGKVVDMFYFPLIQSTWPTWMPIIGGESFTFFDYIFNVADSAIFVGVVIMLLTYNKIENFKR